MPQDFPTGRFDLIVLSEVLYYFTVPDLARVAARCMEALTCHGEIISCHWLGETDYPLTGVQASEHFARQVAAVYRFERSFTTEIYRLERFSGLPYRPQMTQDQVGHRDLPRQI